jgi:hypothetical protein
MATTVGRNKFGEGQMSHVGAEMSRSRDGQHHANLGILSIDPYTANLLSHVIRDEDRAPVPIRILRKFPSKNEGCATASSAVGKTVPVLSGYRQPLPTWK